MSCSHKRARDDNGNADDASTEEEDSDISSLDEMPQEPNEEAHMDSTPSGSTASRADDASRSLTSYLQRRSESGRMRSRSEQSGETQGEAVNSATDVSALSSPSASTGGSASTTSSRRRISPTNNYVQNQWVKILRSFYWVERKTTQSEQLAKQGCVYCWECEKTIVVHAYRTFRSIMTLNIRENDRRPLRSRRHCFPS
jgi:hypothetical protein